MTADRLKEWRELCAWFEERPYNASYSPGMHGCPHTYLLTRGNAPSYCGTKEDRRAWRALARERIELQVIYWQAGMGWRLHKDYVARLDIMEKEVPT